jgi:hypothetical protein
VEFFLRVYLRYINEPLLYWPDPLSGYADKAATENIKQRLSSTPACSDLYAAMQNTNYALPKHAYTGTYTTTATTPAPTAEATTPAPTAATCNDISGSYQRSTDQAFFTVEQTGCEASFTRMTGTVGDAGYSATVSGTTVIRYQSAPGHVQQNGDISFASGILYVKLSGCITVVSMNSNGANLRQADWSRVAEDCCSQCIDDIHCNAWTWIDGSHECWLKMSVPDESQWVSESGVTSGLRQPGLPPHWCCDHAVVDKNSHGTNLRQGDLSSDAGQCCNQCNKDTACNGWTWIAGNGECWLKSGGFLPWTSGWASETGVTSGTKRCWR